MAQIRVFVLSSIGLIAGMVAALYLHGGWQSADIGFILACAGGIAGSIVAFGIYRDRRPRSPASFG
jgi:uncharacterized membrane protein YeaQ/YmgE (transglycosylase-associated protein family)